MAESDIIQNMILQLGQSQDKRLPSELGIHFADVDERSGEDFLLFAKGFAKLVNYYRDTVSAPAADWTNFFNYNEAALNALLENETPGTAPHLALFLSFLELYKKPQQIINRLTGHHLDFYYKDVLQLKKKSAMPDKAHVLVELKKGAAPISISSENQFSAGKDKSGVELIYTPKRETVINTASVDSLRSIFLDKRGHGTVRYAPIANSSDGLGAELSDEEPKWYAFGYEDLPKAEVGFAIASPVLRMKEGTRKITVKLRLSNVDSAKLNTNSLTQAFDAFITGEKSWLGPYAVSPTLVDGLMQFEFTVPETEKAVIDYDAEIHGYSYAAEAPILQLLLKADSTSIGYSDFKNVTLTTALVSVDVSNVTSLSLESDEGVLDPKKAFVPFGAQPTKGSRFMVGYIEAFSKKLSELKIKVQWLNAPANFSTHYSNYGVSGVSNSFFTATVSFKDGGTWANTSYGASLFESDASAEHTFTFAPANSSASPPISTAMSVYALSISGSLWATKVANTLVLTSPVFSPFQSTAPESPSGFITFSLEKDFLHSTYRKKYVEHVMKYSKGDAATLIVLNEPYTPAIQSISLSYKAQTDEVDISSTTLANFSNSDVHFFHVACFGQMREHGYQRAQFDFLSDKSVSLLPAYTNEGELLIGFANLNPNDSVSVLFQVAEGSADPNSEPVDIAWSVLCDNYWKTLNSNEVVLDTTNQLLTSGIITFVIPQQATTQNAILPADRIWLRAAVAKNVSAVCQLIDVAPNAVEVQFNDNGNDLDHLLTALEAGRITKLKRGLSSVKSLRQPYASFGGSPEESDNNFYRRVAERLRHKNRCLTVWDYERIVLEAFPKVHKVKCIPHAKEGSWLAPGHVMLVVVADLKNKNAVDVLQPKVDAITISRITSLVQERIGMQVQLKVKNPAYQKIQLDFKVRFHTGYEFNYYSDQLKQQLIAFLSPWAFDADRDISFGGKVYKSVLLDFVEELEYVDYIKDFDMYTYFDPATKMAVNEAQAKTPDTILISESTHIVTQAGEDT